LQNSTGSSFIPESVKNFWKEAQSNKKTFFNALLDDIGTGKFTSLFQKNGGYAQLTENIKRKFLICFYPILLKLKRHSARRRPALQSDEFPRRCLLLERRRVSSVSWPR